MSSSQALYTQVHSKLHALHPTLHLKRLTVWVWVVVGLIHSQSIHLSEIANHVPGNADAADAQSIVAIQLEMCDDRDLSSQETWDQQRDFSTGSHTRSFCLVVLRQAAM
jgi:hypothetical protein